MKQVLRRSLTVTTFCSMVAVLTLITACSKKDKEKEHASTINVAKIAEQTQRLWDTHEVSNLMGLYVHFNSNGMDADTVGLFAIEDDDVAVEFPNEGRYVGKDEVTKRLTWNERMQHANKPEFYGRFMEYLLTSPIIVVADDGRTAKALWSYQAYEAMNIATDAKKPNVVPVFSTGKVAVDFKRESDKWKIWHLHFYRTLGAANGASWVKQGMPDLPKSTIGIADAAPALQRPGDKESGLVPPHATKDNELSWPYSVEQPYPPREQPRAPWPYANWAATFSY